MIKRNGLQVAAELSQYVDEEALSGVGIDSEAFWKGFDALVHDLAPKNRALLAERDRLQTELDQWHKANPGPVRDLKAYRAFLEGIGYIVPASGAVQATTRNVDTEISGQAGPQLVVPLSNQRYALNAANARWGSLYDALYGTDAIPDTDGAQRTAQFNPVRGARVIARARAFLDEAAPLANGSHADATAYRVEGGKLAVTLKNGTVALKSPGQFIGFQGDAGSPSAVLLKHHGLHFEIQIDATDAIGKTDAAHVKDVLMEAAVSTIIDCEDSVAAVDAADKVQLYRNWTGLMKGDLAEEVTKNGKTFTRRLNADREYTAPDGSTVKLHGTRNVGETAVILDNHDFRLLPNTNVSVTIIIAQHDGVLTIPREALRQDDSKPYVYQIVNDKLRRRAVVVAASNLTRIEVSDRQLQLLTSIVS